LHWSEINHSGLRRARTSHVDQALQKSVTANSYGGSRLRGIAISLARKALDVNSMGKSWLALAHTGQAVLRRI